MNTSLPSFLKNNPFNKFEKSARPLFLVLILEGFLLRAWRFGMSSGDDFNIFYALGGTVIFEIILFGLFFVMDGRRLSQLARFQIFYMAFVPGLSFTYLKRILKPSLAFEVREDLARGKIVAALGLWLPESLKIFQILLPMVIILIMSYELNKDDVRSRFPKWYKYAGIGCGVFSLIFLVFANLTNLCMYIISLAAVCIIWNMWERVRKNKSLEPLVMVSWAEILLFTALWLKGLVENLIF